MMVSFAYLNDTGNKIIATSQNDNINTNIISLDNATISTSLFITRLEASYTCYGGDWRSGNPGFIITLFLSLDNVSWIEVDNYTLSESDSWSNVSGIFTIFNSIFQAFPFDIEQGETLYVSIELFNPLVLIAPDYPPARVRSSTLAIVVPVDIIRAWYFTIDWTLFGIFGSIFLTLFTIFLFSRYNRNQIEKELRAKIKNEEM